MQHIENLIFDLGGVIITLDFSKTEQRFAEMGLKRYKELFANGEVEDFFKQYEVGAISNTVFLNNLRKLAGRDIEDEKLIEAWNAMLGFFPQERIELLKQLRKHYNIYLFSNTNALHLEKFRQIYAEAYHNDSFDDLFDTAYYSHTLGLRKPEINAFKAVLEKEQLDPSKTLFLDDMAYNIEGANKAGLNTIHITPEKSILDIRFVK